MVPVATPKSEAIIQLIVDNYSDKIAYDRCQDGAQTKNLDQKDQNCIGAERCGNTD